MKNKSIDLSYEAAMAEYKKYCNGEIDIDELKEKLIYEIGFCKNEDYFDAFIKSVE
jgi:hypothetical protein